MEMLRLDERNPSFAHEEELAAEFTDEENAAHDDAATDDLASSCSTSSQSSSEGEGSTESAPTPTCDGPAAACSPVALPASPTETCTSNQETGEGLPERAHFRRRCAPVPCRAAASDLRGGG